MSNLPNNENCDVIIALGPTGTGKSSLLSNILKQPNVFPSSEDADSKTLATTSAFGYWENKNILGRLLAVDTPGLSDTQNRDEKHIDNLVEFLKQMSTGVNLFLIVFNGCQPRYDKNYQDILSILETLLTKEFWKHAVIVFTRCDPGGESIWAKNKFESFPDKIKTTFKLDSSINIPVIKTTNQFTNFNEIHFIEIREIARSRGKFTCDLFSTIQATQMKIKDLNNQINDLKKLALDAQNKSNAELVKLQAGAQKELDKLKSDMNSNLKNVLIAAGGGLLFRLCTIL